MSKSKHHPYKNIIILFLICFKSFGGYYKSTPSSFTFTPIRGTSSCTAPTITFSNIEITVTHKDYIDLSFTRTYNGVSNSYVDYVYIGGSSSLTATFPAFTFTCLGAAINFTPQLTGGSLGSATTTSTFKITASGNQSGSSANINASFTFIPEQTAQITSINGETGGKICSNSDMSISLVGDSYTSAFVYYNNILVQTIETNDYFEFNRTTNTFKSSNIFTPNDGTSYQIRVVYYSGGNAAAITRNVTVYTPIPNTNVVSASKPTSCYGESVNLNVVVPTGVNFAWSDGYGVDKSPRPVNDSKEYFIVMSKSGGTCQTQSNKVSIQAIPDFDASISPDRTQACEGQTIQINATTNDANQYNYAWSTGANGSSISVSQNGNYNVSITPKSGGCASKSSNTVNNLSFEKPITGENISLANNKTKAIFCKDETNITLSAAASDLTNVGYQWSGPKTGSSKDLVVENGGEYTVKLFRGACSVEKKITVIGKINLAVNVNPNDARICKGKDKAALMPNVSNGTDYDYQWFGGSDGKTDLKITTVNYDASESGLYRVTLNPKGGNCSANGLYEATRQIVADNAITNFQITGRKANDIVPICNVAAGVNLEATSDSDVMISWNGGTPILKTNIINTKEDNKVFTAKFERGKCVENISLTTKLQELLVSLKTPADINRKYITCADNIDFKLIAESNFTAATIKWKDANNASFAATGKEFTPKATGLYYAVANLAECGPNDSQGSSRADVTLVSDFKVNIASQLANPICDEATQTFTATPTYAAYTGGFSWIPNLSTTKTLQSKAEGSYALTIQQDGCKATATATISVKPSKPTITAIDNFILIASNDTKEIEWLFKELPSSNDPSTYKSLIPAQTTEQIYASKVGAYILKANRNGCGINYSTPFVISVINGKEDLVVSNWEVYPNPAISTITIVNNSPDFSTQNTIEVRNSAGILVKSWIQNENNKKYVLDDLSAGMYHLIFNQKNGRTIKKIIKL